MATGAQRSDQGAARSSHRIQHRLPLLGKKLNEFLGQGLREFGRVYQHIYPPRRRIVHEPGFLKFQPSLGVQIVQPVLAHSPLLQPNEIAAPFTQGDFFFFRCVVLRA
jgi:hypothetical protein